MSLLKLTLLITFLSLNSLAQKANCDVDPRYNVDGEYRQQQNVVDLDWPEELKDLGYNVFDTEVNIMKKSKVSVKHFVAYVVNNEIRVEEKNQYEKKKISTDFLKFGIIILQSNEIQVLYRAQLYAFKQNL